MTLYDLPVYIIYAIAGTSAAALAKSAIHCAQQRAWRLALIRAMAGGGLIAMAFGLLVFLLSRADLSVMAPLAIALNLLTSAVISVLLFRERIDRWKAGGMVLILVGVLLLTRAG